MDEHTSKQIDRFFKLFIRLIALFSLQKCCYNPIQVEKGGGGQKTPSTSFSPVIFTNVRITP